LASARAISTAIRFLFKDWMSLTSAAGHINFVSGTLGGGAGKIG